MPYTESDYPAQIKDLPKHARKIWIGAYNSAYEGYDPEKDQQYDKNKSKAKNRDAYAARVAWGAVKKKYKKNAKGKWVAKALSFDMVITKTVIRDGQRRFFATASSDRIDLLDERLDPSIFDDFVHNFEEGDTPIYVDIAHWSHYFPELRSLVYIGELDHLYRDGRCLKASGFLYDDNKVSDAAWEQMERAARGELDYEIRCSPGFFPDYGNVGYENDVFTYRGGRDKAYMDHLAITAFPANLDADIAPEEVAMEIKSEGDPTLAEDTLRVLGDPELVEELEEARRKGGERRAMSEEEKAMVLKVEEEETPPGEEVEPETEEEPELEEEPVAKGATEEEKKAQQARSKKYGIKVLSGNLTNVTIPKKYADMGAKVGDFADPVNLKYPVWLTRSLKSLTDAQLKQVRNAPARWAQHKDKYDAAGAKKVEARIEKALKKFKVGDYAEKAITFVEEVGRPYGGATSIEEAEDFMEAARDEQKVWDDWYMFQSVAENILRDDEIEDKRVAMSSAISDFRKKLATKSQVLIKELLAKAAQPDEELTPEAETKAETDPDVTPDVEPGDETPAPTPTPVEEALYPAIQQAKSFAEVAEMIISLPGDLRAKRAAMGEALAQTASGIEAVMRPAPEAAPQLDTELIVKAIEAGFERAMAKVMDQLGSELPVDKPPRPQRKSVTGIQPSSIITRGQSFGEIVDRLIGGQV